MFKIAGQSAGDTLPAKRYLSFELLDDACAMVLNMIEPEPVAGDPSRSSSEDELQQPLPVEIPESVVQGVVDSIRTAYQEVAERHDPLVGFDSNTFGFCVYRVSWFLAEQEMDRLHIAYGRPKGSLKIYLKNYSLGIYRGGNDSDWDIEEFDFNSSTPTKSKIPARNYWIQPRLEGIKRLEGIEEDDSEDELTTSERAELTIVHCGNPEQHCTTIYIGLAILNPITGLSEWEWKRRIFRSDNSEAFEGIEDYGNRTASLPRTLFPSYDQVEDQELPLRLNDEPDEEVQ